MIKKVDVAILGAGSASLFALREIKKVTNNYVLIDPGSLGTTCARVGCMPSKLLVQAANDFHNRMKFERQGIKGAEALSVDRQKLLKYVRGQRDHFVGFLMKIIEENKDHLISERAEFISSNVLKIGSNEIQAQKIIIATGSRPKMLPEWKQFGDQIFTSNELFELNDFPD